MRKKRISEQGFTLLEAMIVLVILSALSAIYVSQVYLKKSDVGGGERIITVSVSSIQSRRSEAMRLSGNDRRLDLSAPKTEPLVIDFTDLAGTASLRVDGVDANGDCFDDNTSAQMTCLSQEKDGSWKWKYAYLDDPIDLPDGWVVLGTTKSLGRVPLIGDGEGGRGVMTTKIGFTPDGKAKAFNSKTGTWDSYPEGSVASDHPSLTESPFWAIYFGEVEKSGIRGRQDSIKAAVAIAVHPSGLIERYRYDSETGWIGFNNR